MNYKAGWGFKPMEEIKEYYERTGMIVVSNWALTKYDFEREILRFEGIVNHQNTDQFKQTVTADDAKRIKRRNQEYLHRLYTIKFELDL
ncbi:MAG: hypothetical protein ACFNZZ_04320 [Veillonella parvula]|jgi:hypothetical protein